MSKCDSIIYAKDIVTNKNKKLAANSHYWLVYAEIDGELVPCMLTAHNIESGIDRAKKNKEDITGLSLSWWQKLKLRFNF